MSDDEITAIGSISEEQKSSLKTEKEKVVLAGNFRHTWAGGRPCAAIMVFGVTV